MVVGVGTEWRRDDAAGLHVARGVRATASCGTRAVELAGEPVDLLECWAPASEVIVVDAARSGARAGTIHRVDARRRELPLQLVAGSTHALGLAQAVELARALGRLPAHLLVVGIEGADFSAGTVLSAPVARAVERVVVELRAGGPAFTRRAPH